MNNDTPRYHGSRFPADIIAHAVWLYFRFSLSFRDVDRSAVRDQGVRFTVFRTMSWPRLARAPRIRV